MDSESYLWTHLSNATIITGYIAHLPSHQSNKSGLFCTGTAPLKVFWKPLGIILIPRTKRDDNALTQDTTLNRPAFLEAHKSAQGVPEGGLGADDSTIGQRLLFPDAIELVGSAQQ